MAPGSIAVHGHHLGNFLRRRSRNIRGTRNDNASGIAGCQPLYGSLFRGRKGRLVEGLELSWSRCASCTSACHGSVGGSDAGEGSGLDVRFSTRNLVLLLRCRLWLVVPLHLSPDRMKWRRLTPRWSGRVMDKVSSSDHGVRAAQLNR
jgi:hypothetical protein